MVMEGTDQVARKRGEAMKSLNTRLQRQDADHTTLLASMHGRGQGSSLDRLALRVRRDKLRREQEIFNLALLLAKKPNEGSNSPL